MPIFKMEKLCNDCGRTFIITKADRAYFYKIRQPLPCRCKNCRNINRPQLWYVNKETGDLESVTVINDAGSITFLYRGKERTIDISAVGSRLYRSPGEAWKNYTQQISSQSSPPQMGNP